MAWWWRRARNRSADRSPRALRRIAGEPVVFEELEPRLLLAGDLPSITLIEADNRGLILLTANADLDASTITNTSVQVMRAGADRIFGTPDDVLVQRTVQYDAQNRVIRISANIPADERYMVRLDASIIRGMDGRFLDGEFRGPNTISGDGVQGGDLIFFSRRAAESIVRFTIFDGSFIDVTFFRDRTPLTVQNFLNYANRGVWDQTFIHRSVDGFVIQGGGFTNTPPFNRIPQDPPVLNEPGISNLRGTIAMAKQAGNPNSATSEWFFNLGNNSANLDNQNGGFTVFGEVRTAAGLQAMDRLAAFLTVNASNVNGAFNELPVRDRDAVEARPGATTIFADDLLSFTRIALLVDVTDRATQQLDETGSTVIARPDGAGPRVQIFDIDGVGIGDLSSAIAVRFGARDTIASITIRGPLPAARIGILITNASMVGAITDARRTPDGDIAFIASTAPVQSIRIHSHLSGLNLNEFVLPGLIFDSDIDGDGDFNDRTAVFVPSGLVQSLTLPAGVSGDVFLPGGLGSAVIGGVASGMDFTIGNPGTGRPVSFVFDRLIDVEIRSQSAISSIRAAQWLDTGGRAERISAPSLASLAILGDRRAGVSGDFEAGLNLTVNQPRQRTLGVANIAGSIFGSDWTVEGAIGPVIVRGDATNWTITRATELASLTAGRVNNSTLNILGPVNAVTVTEWQGGTLAAATMRVLNVRGDARAGVAGDFFGNFSLNEGGPIPVIRSMTVAGRLMGQANIVGPVTSMVIRGGVQDGLIRVSGGTARTIDLGPVVNSTINVIISSISLSATRFENAVIQGGNYDAIIARGDPRAGVAGDFIADARPNTIGNLRVQGDFRGVLNARDIRSLTVGGSVTDSVFNFSLAPNPSLRTVDSFTVAGMITNTEIRALGRIGVFTAGGMTGSGLYVGAPAGLFGLPASGAGFRAGAIVEQLNIRGLPGGGPSFFNSFIVSTEIRFAGIAGAAQDNLGRVHGVAVGTLSGGLESRLLNGTVQRLTPSSSTPSPVGDYQVWIGFMPPPTA